MSHFYGTIQGNRGKATRLGHQATGLETIAAGWRGAVYVRVFHNFSTGQDEYAVALQPWQGSGGFSRVIAHGILDAEEDFKPQANKVT